MQQNNTPRPDDHRRMTIFFVCAAVIMTFSYFFITKPQMEKARMEAAHAKSPEVVQAIEKKAGLVPLDEALKEVKRATMETPKLAGSVPLKGLRFDDIELKDYYTTLENDK